MYFLKEDEGFLAKKIDELNENLTKSNLAEIAQILGDRKKLFFRNILSRHI